MPLTITRTTKTAYFYPQPLGKSTLEMVYIPGGSFMMGSPDDEPDRSASEGPQHEVQIKPFFMSKYPITQAQWEFVASLPTVKHELEDHPSYFKGNNRPVEQVSWWEAVEFCDRLSGYTKLPYRLPAEAEWEYACRAGTKTPFHFGQTLTDDLVNYGGNVTSTTPVGQYSANAFGLYDMHGNVFEWCADHWHFSYNGAPNDGSVWLTEDENARRVMRGGAWFYGPRDCRSASRDYILSPDLRSFSFGFRVVSFPQDLS